MPSVRAQPARLKRSPQRRAGVRQVRWGAVVVVGPNAVTVVHRALSLSVTRMRRIAEKAVPSTA